MHNARLRSRLFQVAAGIAAVSPLVVLIFVGFVLFSDAWPAFKYQGLSFFTGITWNMGNMYANAPVVHNGVQAAPGATFGILPFIVGTLGSSLIAMIIGVPISLLSAFALVFKIPPRYAKWISSAIELLAGIPSVVFGLWGMVVLAPIVVHQIEPWLSHLGGIFPFFAGSAGSGFGLLTSGLVLAVMIIPIITATSRDLIAQVPKLSIEGAQALGMTTYESVRHIALPLVRRGIIGAIILGWGRALGETMAVLMVSGNATNYLPNNLYSPISTMASTVAALLDGALNDFTSLSIHALALIAVTLLIITMITNLLARLLVQLGRRDVGTEA